MSFHLQLLSTWADQLTSLDRLDLGGKTFCDFCCLKRAVLILSPLRSTIAQCKECSLEIPLLTIKGEMKSHMLIWLRGGKNTVFYVSIS